MLRRGDTQGVFQLESEGMTKLVMDLAPEKIQRFNTFGGIIPPGAFGHRHGGRFYSR